MCKGVPQKSITKFLLTEEVVALVFVFVEICWGWVFLVNAVEITLDFNSCFKLSGHPGAGFVTIR